VFGISLYRIRRFCFTVVGELRLAITADNMVTRLYVDGVLMSLSNANDWSKVDTITIPADSHVVAVEGRDVGVSSSSL